jgi:purine-binding chemotaxis protein CheW
MEEADKRPDEQAPLEQFVVFKLGPEEYAVPILAVTEVVNTVEITPVPDAPDYILGLINLRGKIVPVLDLDKRFGLAEAESLNRQHILVAESQQHVLFGFLVDQVTEVLKISKDHIKPAPDMVKSKISAEYLPGVIIFGEEGQPPETERIILILDLQKILSDKEAEQLQTVQGNGSTDQPATTNSNEGGES